MCATSCCWGQDAMGVSDPPGESGSTSRPVVFFDNHCLTVSAVGWIARVGPVSRSYWPVRTQRQIAVTSPRVNLSKSHTGIGNVRGSVPVISR